MENTPVIAVLAPLALAAALLAIPADEARAHNDNSATLHVETYPLHEAARTGDLDAVNHFIIVHMADVNATTSYGDTPLHYATGDGTGVGHVPVVSVLIAAGANVNAKEDEGQVPLHQAAIKGNIPVISMLIAAGADVNARNGYNQTPLHEAAEGGKAIAISVLIAAGASVNAKDAGGGTPLNEAARLAGYDHISVAVFSALLAAGADVNAKNNNGKTPLHIVISERNQAVALVLLAFGADVHIEDDESYPALIEAAYYGLLDVVNRLLELGADVNAKGDDGWTALHEAAFNAHLDVVNRLLESGGDVNATISSGEFSGATPLEVASRRKHEDVRDRLIEHGGHWGEACGSGNVVNPAGPSPPCVAVAECASPSVLNAGANRCDCPAPNVETNLGACEVAVVCASPSVLNVGANRCDCPAPNVGTDGAGAPGNCVAASTESCGGLTPPAFYSATLSACVPFVECAAPSVLDAGANRCDCPTPNIGTDGADAPGDCAVPSAESCGGLTPAKFYDSAAGECIPFAECHDTAELNQETNECECTKSSNAEYLRTSGVCRSSCNAAERSVEQGRTADSRYNGGNFYYYKCKCPTTTATDVNGICEFLYPCHDSAIVKADNSGCECPAGTFAHGDPSGGKRYRDRRLVGGCLTFGIYTTTPINTGTT